MPGPSTISCEKLTRLLGAPQSPVIVDARVGPMASKTVTGVVPSSLPYDVFLDWEAGAQISSSIVVVCHDGGARSHGVAAVLRARGRPAEVLDGGMNAWIGEGRPLLSADRLPARNDRGQTVWVTRARPKVDRIACPWLIRRFVDPRAQFLFVPASEVEQVARQYNGAPFDIEGEGVFWSHRGDLCTFDVMVEEFGLSGIAPLQQLRLLVRGADTNRLDLAPQAAGLLAASLGLSRMYADDLAQLDAAMLIYDAFYRWARDAASETHDWVSHQPRGPRT